MYYTRGIKYNVDSHNDFIDFYAALKFLANPDKIINILKCNDYDTALVNRYAVYISELSENEIALLLHLIAQGVYTLQPELKKVYDAIKIQSKDDHLVYRSDINALNDILVTIKDNWQSIAIIALFMRGLSKNKITYEGESVFESISKLLDKFKDQ